MSRRKDIERAQREREALRVKMLNLNFRCSEEEFARFDQPDTEERDTIPFIKRYLLTEEQRVRLFHRDVSIEDLLNGRVENDPDASFVSEFFADWNAKLGYGAFG